MSDAEKEPLKPCPFCGSGNVGDGWTCCRDGAAGKFEEVIVCRDCGAMGPPFIGPWRVCDTYPEARALWNARPAPNEPPRQGG